MIEPSGTTTLIWHDQILTVHVQGPLNLDAAERNFKKIQDTVLNRDFDCWARIDILADDTFGSTDVLSVAGASFTH